MDKIEYRVRSVTRYIVTRYEQSGNGGACDTKGEYGNVQTAYDVAHALCREEHNRLGWPIDDERIVYPACFPVTDFGPEPIAVTIE